MLDEQQDTLMWHHESNGIYTVKSGYALAMHLKDQSPSASVANILHTRYINDSTTCFICNGDKETIIHALFLCKRARQLEKFATILWSIWSERNKERHGTLPKQADTILYFALSYLEDYHEARKAQNCVIVSNQSSAKLVSWDASWLNAPSGHLKLDTDAAVDITKHVTGFGAVLRNSSGDILVAMAVPFKGCFKP
ncbi:hypothetical protein CsatB_004326 [Cannabis sativa]|uniref:uncharacterized protein LOC133038476 n=1 Tax=Cannabis sativa TaxID=3483 RepID=UPI0029C9D00F|nr:uncharacterized protein LOC133038476 [Cannabis sativa]